MVITYLRTLFLGRRPEIESLLVPPNLGSTCIYGGHYAHSWGRVILMLNHFDWFKSTHTVEHRVGKKYNVNLGFG